MPKIRKDVEIVCNDDAKARFESVTECSICTKTLNREEEVLARNHCHFTGFYNYFIYFLTKIITIYLTAMSDIAILYCGTVDKYIGDAIMIFFGDPNSNGKKRDAIAGVSMALKMKKALNLLIF